MKPLIIIGNGGHARACMDVIISLENYKIEGLILSDQDFDKTKSAYPVLGKDQDLKKLLNSSKNVFIGVGQIKNFQPRLRLYKLIKDRGAKLPTIISPIAFCSQSALIGEGSILMHNALVNANTKVGVNCIINTKALLEHDVDIGSHCHISTGAIINGGVKIGEKSFIGSGVVMKEGIEIGKEVIIGAGLTITKNIPDGRTVKRQNDE